MLMTSAGQSVVLKEKVTFSDMVNQPILSFGRLMKSGCMVDRWATQVPMKWEPGSAFSVSEPEFGGGSFGSSHH